MGGHELKRKRPFFVKMMMFILVIIITGANYLIMSSTLNDSNMNFFEIMSSDSSDMILYIISIVLACLFYFSVFLLVISGLTLFSKKRKKIFDFFFIYSLIFETLILVVYIIYSYVTSFQIILVGCNYVLTFILLALIIFRTKRYSENIVNKNEVVDNKNITFKILIIDILAVLMLFTTFFIPLYSYTGANGEYTVLLLNVISGSDTSTIGIIFFLVDFILILEVILYFTVCITNYFYDKLNFVQKSKSLVSFAFFIALVFFASGLTMFVIYSLEDYAAETYAIIPMVLLIAVMFVLSIYIGKFNFSNGITNPKKKVQYSKFEHLLYVFILTILVCCILIVPIISISISSSGYASTVEMTGYEILKEYTSLDSGYRYVAYLLMIVFMSSGIALVIVISAYLSNYKKYNSIVRGAAFLNVFFLFLFSVSGYYFQIAHEIDQSEFETILSAYSITLSSDSYDYTVTTDAIYLLYIAVGVLVIMFLRHSFDGPEGDLRNSSIEGGASSGGKIGTNIEDNSSDFDPCPAFTELDSRLKDFKDDYAQRLKLKVEDTSLNKLVNFIVEYARDSRLHLSYTTADIATFVAGLGASKLSILQGMSGTGKTSLPKIFSEAIFGNCEIIEVASSWKDKNELLGYYNEFSMKYTPKKFTQALYKASLNPEILTFVLLDEMNLSRIEYYFSDFLSLMENEEDQRELKLLNLSLARKEAGTEVKYLSLNNGHTLKIPANVWFIGTANRDESTFVISDKVYDRAQTMNFTKRAPKVRNFSDPIPKEFYDYKTFNDLLIYAKNKGTFDAEKNDLIRNVEQLLLPFNISFGNRILKQIEDFVNIYEACFPLEDVESVAVEKILLSKVVAKLEVKTVDDNEKLAMEFEKLNLLQCVEFIKNLDSD